MTGEPGSADIVAKKDCSLIKIPREIFSSIIVKNASALAKVASIITKRLIKMDIDEHAGVSQKLAISQTEMDDPYNLLFSSTDISIKILVINCGSSSIKYSLFDTSKRQYQLEGLIEKINKPQPMLTVKSRGKEIKKTLSTQGIVSALEEMTMTLVDPTFGLLIDLNEISAVGHRVVHGGEKLYASVVITDEIKNVIKEYSAIAPLHNPFNLAGIEYMQNILKTATHVAVFDTAFHQTIPSNVYRYALPYDMCTKDKIRRYGFHGTNHEFVALKAAMYFNKPLGELNMISCHLGNGASICAINHGRSVDTSMGMTPLEGLIMGTRSGDIDPGVILYMLKTLGMSADEVDDVLNRQSGLLGISGKSSDMRELYAEAENYNTRANDAITMFCYRIKKYIGSYIAVLGSIDAIIFTGGIGENAADVRARVCQGLEHLGIMLYSSKNRDIRALRGEVLDIAEPGSKIKILIIPAEEERMIARETLHAIERDKSIKTIGQLNSKPIPISVSAHHVHLTKEDFGVLFGQDTILTPRSQLSQPGQFASQQTVNLIGPKGRVERVRILGPFRDKSQVEISRTEEFKLGIDAPVRNSGDTKGTPGLELEGEAGRITIKEGVICARRHIHMSPEDALGFGLRDKDIVMVRVKTVREVIFGDVLIRIHPDFRLDMHLDTDEANAAEIDPSTIGFIEAIQSRVYL
jgi:acetate kinase